MRIRDRLVQIKAVAVAVGSFISRHKRASIAVGVAFLIAGPLLTRTGGETFFFNLLGLGIVALVVRRIVRANERRQAAQARQANCRCHCHRQGSRQTQPTQQPTTKQQQQGGTP